MLGIVGLLLSPWVIGMLPGVAAVVLGFPALDRVGQGRANNRGLVKAALWCGFAAIVIGSLALLVAVISVTSEPSYS